MLLFHAPLFEYYFGLLVCLGYVHPTPPCEFAVCSTVPVFGLCLCLVLTLTFAVVALCCPIHPWSSALVPIGAFFSLLGDTSLNGTPANVRIRPTLPDDPPDMRRELSTRSGWYDCSLFCEYMQAPGFPFGWPGGITQG